MTYDKNISPVGWYVASYILRFVISDDSSNEDPEARFLTWTNTMLVKASNLDEAYDKVVRFASRQTKSYKGGKKAIGVQWVFEGITNLLPIYEEIEDGSEIMWGESTGKLKNIRKRVRTRSEFHQ